MSLLPCRPAPEATSIGLILDDPMVPTLWKFALD